MSRYITHSKKQKQSSGNSSTERIQTAVHRGLRRLNILPTTSGTPQLLTSDSWDEDSDMSVTMTSEQEELAWRTTSTPSPAPTGGQVGEMGIVGNPTTSGDMLINYGEELQVKLTEERKNLDSQSIDGRGTPTSGSDSGQTVIGDGLATRSSLTDLNQLQTEASFNKVVIDPQRVAALAEEDFLGDDQWGSPLDQIVSINDEREKQMIEQQK